MYEPTTQCNSVEHYQMLNVSAVTTYLTYVLSLNRHW